MIPSNAKILNLGKARVDISTGAHSDAANEYQSGFITVLQDSLRLSTHDDLAIAVNVNLNLDDLCNLAYFRFCALYRYCKSCMIARYGLYGVSPRYSIAVAC